MSDPFDICATIVKEECYLNREPMCDFERAIAGTGQAIIDRIKRSHRGHPAQAAARIEELEAALREATIVTDEMVMAGAKAMVRLGHDHRARGEPMPTRLQEARACLTARAALEDAGK
jgi:hypothetical protein